MNKSNDVLDNVIIKFAGDSGMACSLPEPSLPIPLPCLAMTSALFPTFRQKSVLRRELLQGVGVPAAFWQCGNFYTGDQCDVLVVMNAAALKANIAHLKKKRNAHCEYRRF
jgi:2-oxoglutarate ferredoxin oxidoreductase subunit alpha